MARITVLLAALTLTLASAVAHAKVVRVPEDAVTLQAAVAQASPGDTVQVGPGRWCGATVDRRLDLVGAKGAVIVGRIGDVTCSDALHPAAAFPMGVYLSSSSASGTSIRHFTFDGSQAATEASALMLAVYALDLQGGKIDDVRIEHNTILGTIQAITNKGGDDWIVRHNEILGLTTHGGMGGVGIAVVDQMGVRPGRASVSHNRIDGQVPDEIGYQWFTGVHLGSTDDADVSHNRFRFVRRRDSAVQREGAGVVVCEENGGGTRGARVTSNDGTASDYVVVVMGPGATNSAGLTLKNNIGEVLIEGESADEPVSASSAPATKGGKGSTGKGHGRAGRVL